MSLHLTPNEPDDWTHGSEPEGVCCHNCDGTGDITGDDDRDYTCPMCGGSGFIDYSDCEPDWGDGKCD